jgi:5-methylcytosine-specific restriction endonuclease McrA
MSKLSELEPKKLELVKVLLKRAGIKVKENRYFLSKCAFVQDGIVVLNKWYKKEIMPEGENIVIHQRLPTTSERVSARSKTVLDAIKLAYEKNLKIRIIVLDGETGIANTPSKVFKRSLDPITWSVKTHNEKTGKCVLVRDIQADNGSRIKNPILAAMRFKPTANRDELEEKTQELLLSPPLTEKPAGQKAPRKVETKTQSFKCDPRVRAYVRRAAHGRCELCKHRAPFKTDKGIPFLEVHHVKPLAKRGSDRITNAVGVCPNCHRSLHQAKDSENRREKLYRQVKRLKRE